MAWLAKAQARTRVRLGQKGLIGRPFRTTARMVPCRPDKWRSAAPTFGPQWETDRPGACRQVNLKTRFKKVIPDWNPSVLIPPSSQSQVLFSQFLSRPTKPPPPMGGPLLTFGPQANLKYDFPQVHHFFLDRDG